MTSSPDRRNSPVLKKIGEINKHQSWFIVDTPDQTALVIPDLAPIATQFRDALQPFMGTDSSLLKAWKTADQNAAMAAVRSGRKEEWDLAYNSANDLTIDKLRQAVSRAVSGNGEESPETRKAYGRLMKSTLVSLSGAAAWEVVADLPEFQGKQNPNAVLLEYFDLGIGMVRTEEIEGSEILLAHAVVKPFRKSAARFFACVGETDPGLNFKHQIAEDCMQRVST